MKRLSQLGFTMIELLIVISVLGILATGVLAAVDPFEQLKKARDTNNRQSVLALQTAMIRYYATHGALPWDNASVAATCDGATLFGAVRDTPATVTALEACVELLEGDGELKDGFVGALGSVADNVQVYSPDPTTGGISVSVCYVPTSKSIWAEDNTKYDNKGVDLTASATPTCDATWKIGNPTLIGTTCYYCAT